ncbi:hypothetical protein GCM10025858_02170 [Alicyclobacillus sacchari]|nr:hypothetical protein GCM10025858_02170 [Alicyclobacillus sacchari]
MKEWIVRLAAEIAPSGSEGRITSVLLDAVQDIADETHMDALGNAIATKRGEGPHVMIAAHMDEPGVMVIDIDDDGFLRVIPTGGLTASEAAFRQVAFTNGTVGLVCLEDGEKRPEQFEQLFVDIGAKHRQEAESRAFIGLGGVLGTGVADIGNGGYSAGLWTIGSVVPSPCTRFVNWHNSVGTSQSSLRHKMLQARVRHKQLRSPLSPIWRLSSTASLPPMFLVASGPR